MTGTPPDAPATVAGLPACPWDDLADPAAFAASYPCFLAAFTPESAPEAAASMPEPVADPGASRGERSTNTGEPDPAANQEERGTNRGGAGPAGGDRRGVAELEWRIFKGWTTRLEESLTLVHAAVLGRHGRALVVAGRTGKGKTTLALALLARRWTFLSDDCAVLGPTGASGDVAVWPAPGAMHVKGRLSQSLAESLSRLLAAVPYPPGFFPGTEGTARCCLVRPEALAPPGRPWPVAAVVLLERRAEKQDGEGVPPVLERLTAGKALTELTFHSFARTRDRLGRDFRLLARLVRAVPCYSLVSANPDATAAFVEGVVGPE